MFPVEQEFRARSAMLLGTVRLSPDQKNYWREIKDGEPSLGFTFVVLLLSPSSCQRPNATPVFSCACVYMFILAAVSQEQFMKGGEIAPIVVLILIH